jgi:hypothetical protein
MAYFFCSQQYHLKFIKAMQDSLQVLTKPELTKP